MLYNGVGDPHRISYMTNCALQSEELGVGVSIGLLGGFCSNDAEPGFTDAGVNVMTFDDQPHLFVPSEGYGASETTFEQTIMWESVSNGVLGITPARAGLLTHAFTKAYHMPNEAGTRYFKQRLGFSDEEIRAFRYEALTFFRDHFQVSQVDPDFFNDQPLNITLDLGGGNHIIPYTVVDQANHHLVGMRSPDGAVLSNARVHEVGFVLNVGRAGLWSYFGGHIQFGGMIHYGYYVVELDSGDNVPVKFYDHYPQVPNTNSHFAVVQRVIHPEYGYGTLHGLALTMPDGDRHQCTFRMNWRWDNA